MKQSHYTTPRTMSEARWLPCHAPIERPYRRNAPVGKWALLITFALLALSFIVAKG